jgi:hypothetical protein
LHTMATSKGSARIGRAESANAPMTGDYQPREGGSAAND